MMAEKSMAGKIGNSGAQNVSALYPQKGANKGASVKKGTDLRNKG